MRNRWAKLCRRATILVAGAIGLVATDSIVGVWYHTNALEHLWVKEPRSGITAQVIVVFPGYIMPGEFLSEALAPHLGDNDAMITIGYAERGLDIGRIYRDVTAEIARLRPTSIRVYGVSMGGMCAKEFLDRYERGGAPYGKVVLILDTAPSERGDVRRPRLLFGLAGWYRGGPLSSAVWAVASRGAGHPPGEAGADPQTIRDARHADAWVGTPAITTQAAYISGFRPPRPNELVAVAARVAYLRGRPPGNDPVVRVDDATAGWRRAFPGLTVRAVTDRRESWHVPVIERPRATMELILAA